MAVSGPYNKQYRIIDIRKHNILGQRIKGIINMNLKKKKKEK